MIFFNNQLLKGCTIALTNFLSILIVNHVIRLTIHKEGRHCTFSNILEFYIERIVLEFATIPLCHFKGKRNHELRCFYIFVCYLESNYLERVKWRVSYLQQHVIGFVLHGVKDSRGGSHRTSPKYKSFKANLSEETYCTISQLSNALRMSYCYLTPQVTRSPSLLPLPEKSNEHSEQGSLSTLRILQHSSLLEPQPCIKRIQMSVFVVVWKSETCNFQ